MRTDLDQRTGAGRLHPGALVVVVAFLLVAFAGCVDDTPDTAPAPGAETSRSGPSTATQDASDPKVRGSAHVHDHWYGADQVLLLEDSVPVMVVHNHMLDEPPREQHTHGCDETAVSDSQGGSRKFSLPPGMTVIPGTGTLEFVAEWDEPSITGIHLYYRPAGRGHEEGHDHDTPDTRRPPRSGPGAGGTTSGYRDGGILVPGEPVRIPVAPHQVDDGHALRSHWGFFLCADSDLPVALAEGNVALAVIAHRQDPLPVDPLHPDHWQGRDRLHLAHAAFEGRAVTVANKGDNGFVHIPFNASAIVAPGTVRLVVPMEVEGGSPTGLDTTGFSLYWKDPTVPGWVYAQQSLIEDADGARFVVPVAEDAVDSVYATQTDWDLYLRIRSTQHAETAAGDMAAPDVFEGEVRIDVWAEMEDV